MEDIKDQFKDHWERLKDDTNGANVDDLRAWVNVEYPPESYEDREVIDLKYKQGVDMLTKCKNIYSLQYVLPLVTHAYIAFRRALED